MRIALDAGHGSRPGGSHTGAAANGLVEDEVALDLVSRIGRHLRAGGHETVLTRPDAKVVPLVERARTARALGCDALVSIHCNAGPASACGAEAFVAEGDERSRKLAARLVEVMARRGLRSRGVKWDSQSRHSRLAVLRGTYRQMPAVLLEIGFLTSPHDAGLLKDTRWREETAMALTYGVLEGVPHHR